MEVSGYEAIEYCKASIKCPDGKEEYELVLLKIMAPFPD